MAEQEITPDWRGRKYWLLGASEGIGRALARTMSRSGVELYLSGRNAARLDELKDELPGKAHVVPVDVTSGAELDQAAAEVGPVDGLVYMAGVGVPVKTTEWDAGAVELMLDTNLMGAVRVLGRVIPGMVQRGKGHVLLTGSLLAYRGLPGSIGYGASKAGLMSLAETMHADLHGTGIKVQIVNPGFVRTNMTEGNPGRKPGMIEPEAAAQEIWEHMGTDRFSKAFPLGPTAAIRAASILPTWAFERLFR